MSHAVITENASDPDEQQIDAFLASYARTQSSRMPPAAPQGRHRVRQGPDTVSWETRQALMRRLQQITKQAADPCRFSGGRGQRSRRAHRRQRASLLTILDDRSDSLDANPASALRLDFCEMRTGSHV